MNGAKKYKTCDRKKKYVNIDEAMIQGKFCMAKEPRQLYTYLCPFCNSWHLTHTITKYKVI